MIVWKFALYLGVMTLLFAFLIAIVAITRFGRGETGGAKQPMTRRNDSPGSPTG